MINKKIGILLVVLLTAGCGSSQPDKSYYQLPATASVGIQKSAVPPERQIQLIGVNLADYLNGLGIGYQTSDVQFVIANNNLWAGNLQRQLQQALLENLNSELPGWLITDKSTVNGNKVLSVNVTGFHGRYDGVAVVRGEWTLSNGERILTKPFNIELPQPEDGYDSLVRTLALGWQRQSEEMAQVIAGMQFQRFN